MEEIVQDASEFLTIPRKLDLILGITKGGHFVRRAGKFIPSLGKYFNLFKHSYIITFVF